MESVVLISLAILGGLVSISQYFTFKKESKNKEFRFRYMILSFSLTACAVIASAMVLTYGSNFCFILYGLDKFLKVLIMCEITLLTQDIIGVSGKYCNLFVTIISYGSVFLYFLDSLLQGGHLSKSPCGVYFAPKHPLHLALYFVYYMFYVLILAAFIVYRASVVVRKCHKHELIILSGAYCFSGAGFLTEIYIFANGTLYIPFILIFNLVAVVMMRRLLVYHESITITDELFATELDPGRTDIALILDDTQTVIYQNKKAEIISSLINDKFLDRKISDIFLFSSQTYNHFMNKADGIPFGISGDYEPNGHHVNLIVQHRLDNFGEILASSILVYNLEETDKTQSSVGVEEEADDKQLIASAIPITHNARILVVDHDVVFLNVFTRLLSQFGVSITRAINGFEAVDKVENHVFDMIFISCETTSSECYDTVKRIRALDGEYFKQVPVVFVTEANINDVYVDFVDAGFNDYLPKPISKKSLSAVLTRWLWQRFSDDSTQKAKMESSIKAQYGELILLVRAAEEMLKKKDYTKLSYVLNGIKRACIVLDLIDSADSAAQLQETIMLGDDSEVDTKSQELLSSIVAIKVI